MERPVVNAAPRQRCIFLLDTPPGPLRASLKRLVSLQLHPRSRRTRDPLEKRARGAVSGKWPAFYATEPKGCVTLQRRPVKASSARTPAECGVREGARVRSTLAIKRNRANFQRTEHEPIIFFGRSQNQNIIASNRYLARGNFIRPAARAQPAKRNLISLDLIATQRSSFTTNRMKGRCVRIKTRPGASRAYRHFARSTLLYWATLISSSIETDSLKFRLPPPRRCTIYSTPTSTFANENKPSDNRKLGQEFNLNLRVTNLSRINSNYRPTIYGGKYRV